MKARQVAADEREMVHLVETPNCTNTIERLLVAAMTTERVRRISRNDHTTGARFRLPATALSGMPDER
jgi:hypothetical protein